ncbi:hypothetical protein ABIA33_003821 [Streptacidiphilus sp. MAP12-16]
MKGKAMDSMLHATLTGACPASCCPAACRCSAAS